MEKILLDSNGEFVVKENRLLSYIISILFFTLFFYGLIGARAHGFDSFSYTMVICSILFIPGIAFLIKAKSRRVYIRINRTGIYQNERLVTSWSNFMNAYVTQKQVLLSIQDNFILVIEYIKDGSEKGFRRRIPLTNTQDKAEEEVLAAVKLFWKEYTGDVG